MKHLHILITAALLFLTGCPENDFDTPEQQVSDIPAIDDPYNFNNSVVEIDSGKFIFFFYDNDQNFYMRTKSSENSWDGPSQLIYTMEPSEVPSDAALLSNGNIAILSKRKVYNQDPNIDYDYNYYLYARIIGQDGSLIDTNSHWVWWETGVREEHLLAIQEKDEFLVIWGQDDRPEEPGENFDTKSMRISNTGQQFIGTEVIPGPGAYINLGFEPSIHLDSTYLGSNKYLIAIKFNTRDIFTDAPRTEISYYKFDSDYERIPNSGEYFYSGWFGDMKIVGLTNGNAAVAVSPIESFTLGGGSGVGNERTTRVATIDTANYHLIQSTLLNDASLPLFGAYERWASDITAHPDGGFGVAWHKLTYDLLNSDLFNDLKVTKYNPDGHVLRTTTVRKMPYSEGSQYADYFSLLAWPVIFPYNTQANNGKYGVYFTKQDSDLVSTPAIVTQNTFLDWDTY